MAMSDLIAEPSRLALPLFASHVQCGFPSPAQDYIEQRLDLNQLCIPHPAATFYLRARGDSMQQAGIQEGDLLIVDRSVTPEQGHIVIASLNGEFTVKYLQLRPCPALIPANPNYPPLYFTADTEVELFGVVTYVLHKTR